MLYVDESSRYPRLVAEPTWEGDESQLARISALVEDVRRVLRTRHYSSRTETVYLGWIKRFILANRLRHPSEMGQREGEAFGSQMKSPEAMEAFMAFTQKRAPDFSKAG